MIPGEVAEVCRLNGFEGWRCVREAHGAGPCALVPKWWNLASKWRYRKNLNP